MVNKKWHVFRFRNCEFKTNPNTCDRLSLATHFPLENPNYQKNGILSAVGSSKTLAQYCMFTH